MNKQRLAAELLKVAKDVLSAFKPNFDDADEYVQFITRTLIPDLRRSGHDGTVDDLRDLVKAIKTGKVNKPLQSFLERTLIPDLEESGSEGMVDDFREGIYWMTNGKARNAAITEVGDAALKDTDEILYDAQKALTRVKHERRFDPDVSDSIGQVNKGLKDMRDELFDLRKTRLVDRTRQGTKRSAAKYSGPAGISDDLSAMDDAIDQWVREVTEHDSDIPHRAAGDLNDLARAVKDAMQACDKVMREWK